MQSFVKGLVTNLQMEQHFVTTFGNGHCFSFESSWIVIYMTFFLPLIPFEISSHRKVGVRLNHISLSSLHIITKETKCISFFSEYLFLHIMLFICNLDPCSAICWIINSFRSSITYLLLFIVYIIWKVLFQFITSIFRIIPCKMW